MRRSTIIILLMIAAIAAYLIPRDNKKKDQDFAWVMKWFKSSPTAVAGEPHARRI